MHSAYFLLYLFLHRSRHSTTSCQDSQLSLPVQSVELQSLHQHSQLASVRHSLSFTQQSMLRSLLRRCRRAALRLILLTQDGTEQASVSLLRIHVVSLMLSSTVIFLMLQQRRFLSLTLRFQQSFLV